MAKEDSLFNYDKVWNWIKVQGIGIVLLSVFCFIEYQQRIDLTKDVKILNEKLIDCEKSKVYLKLSSDH